MKPSTPRWVVRLGEVLTHDYFPSVDPYLLDWARKPLGALGLAAGAAALCGIFLHPHGFVVFGGIVLVVVLGLVWPWLSMRGLSGTLCFDRTRVPEGDPVTVRLTVRNRAPWGAWGLGVQLDCSSTPGTGLAYAPGWRTTEVQWQFVSQQRGEYPRGAPRLTCGFPFGLWRAGRAVTVTSRLLVWPRTVPPGPIPQAAGDRGQDGLTYRNQAGTTGDVLGVRPYRRGDWLRRIHWPQTARHDRLIVCELQAPAHPLVQVVLETDPAVHAGTGPDSSREWAIRIAASLLEGWLDQGAQLEAVFDGRVIDAGAGAAHARRLLDALARIPAERGASLGALAELPALGRLPGGLRIIVTTDRGLQRAPARVHREPRQRFVVLHAAAFAGDGPPPGDDAALPVRPWVRLDDPTRVAAQFRQAWKEIVHGV
jgi:uncharacterized protein (DUF58 family)